MHTYQPRSALPWAAAALAVVLALPGLPAAACSAHSAQVVLTAEEMDWQPGPGSLPAGAEVVMLEGDPAAAGPLTLRLKFPAGYRIPAHSHPAIEHVTVLSGVFHVGMGDAFDEDAGSALPQGGFSVMPVGHNHYAWTEEETVIQLHSVGPWGITYVDPGDDPRMN